jgi:hypothetical protein
MLGLTVDAMDLTPDIHITCVCVRAAQGTISTRYESNFSVESVDWSGMELRKGIFKNSVLVQDDCVYDRLDCRGVEESAQGDKFLNNFLRFSIH